jgi:hypothetical protein
VTLVTVVCGAAIVLGLWPVNRDRSRPAVRRPAARTVAVPEAA